MTLYVTKRVSYGLSETFSFCKVLNNATWEFFCWTAMPDMFTKEKRSEIMSKIRSKGSKIELKMKKVLEENNIKFEYQPKMFGSPDFLIPPNIVIFCDSSFWHGRNWNNLRLKLSKNYWYDHIKENRRRDRKVNAELKKKGCIVLRFWDTQIEKQIDECIKQIRELLGGKTKHGTTL